MLVRAGLGRATFRWGGDVATDSFSMHLRCGRTSAHSIQAPLLQLNYNTCDLDVKPTGLWAAQARLQGCR
jgi:hypothetical protein